MRSVSTVVRLPALLGLLAACGADEPSAVSNTPAETPDAGFSQDAAADIVSERVDDAEVPDAADPPPDAGDPWATSPTRYPADSVLSPVSPYVAANLRAIALRDPSTEARVFMKAGASGTVSKNLLSCFAGQPGAFYTLDLDGRDELQGTVDWFRGGDAAGATPFDRITLCAEVGRTASWAISGSPSPLEREMAALHPRFAVVNYGTNDMQMGTTYRSALYPFYDNLSALIDQLLDAGVVPLISGLGPRGDSVSAAWWVPTYNAVTRGIAEARQLPYLNMFQAYIGLPGMGLSSDGLHGNVYASGGETMPCVFDADGLEFAYNTRNLATLAALHSMRAVVNDAAIGPDSTVPPVAGSGSKDDPWMIDSIPFTHSADTSASPNDVFDAYPACDGGQDESGPEYVYRLELGSETAVRIAVLDGTGVDVDLHLLGDTAAPETCVARADRMIERTLGAGVHDVVVDTFAAGGEAQSGPYLLVVTACEAGDPDCG